MSAIGHSLETDFFMIDSELTDHERDYWRRARDFVDGEVLPVISGYWERAEFPLALVEKLRRSASSATASSHREYPR
jgi:glutaryl-CoA dehydrogenase